MRHRKSIVLLFGGIFIVIIAGFIAMVGFSLGLLAVDYWLGNPQASARKVVIKTINDYVSVTPDQMNVEFTTMTAPASKPISSGPARVQVNNPDPAGGAPQAPALAASALNSPLPTLTPTSVILTQGTLTATPSPTATPFPTVTSSPTGTPSPTVSPTPTIITPNRISGRVVLNGQAVNDDVLLKLEDAAGHTVAETTVAEDGRFTFANVASSDKGYVVVFAQEWNSQYDVGEVISWGWLGHVPVETGEEVALPDLDISLKGFEQVSPEPNAKFSSAEPIQFEWRAYPGASSYWLDLIREDEQNVLWQSAPVQALSLTFDGKTKNGDPIQPGEYWWGVGARRNVNDYTMAVYGYLPALLIDQ
jgi:hypothetical protein